MAFYIDLFSPETYEIFSKSNQDISGFRLRQEGAASASAAPPIQLGLLALNLEKSR